MVGLIMKLTDEQIAELAPDWATHYRKAKLSDTLVFESVAKYQFYRKGVFGMVHLYSYGKGKRNKLGKPILRKEFDISDHEFSDTAKDCGVEFSVPAWVYPDIEINVKDTNGGDNTALLMKEHAIVIAKHFKLTAEDLK